MFGIVMPEMIIIVIVSLVFFGPGRVPELGSSIGKATQGFKKAMTETEKEPDSKQDRQG
ncbi:MAG: twin-arginine translocase TatA/TatE family subunit [Syntrophaceae bacterium]|nr:twin-arginine translocase TatA/TatE family subunit [Syntrophaceae bacterium]